ncbi:MAG: histidinol-phosphate transaminase [Candidatus Planktophila sp.]|jgi:histidinol-phosphate aminotransferase|tara:strand:- start:2917 stop:4026 length:1110 start_codon:yes stop_codon:yes gene_type:complete
MNAKIWPEWLPLRDDLKDLSPYGAPQIPAQASLNTNENPFPLSSDLASAITNRVNQISTNLNRYPDRDAVTLRSKLSDFINSLSGTSFSADQIWVGNGSNEIIQSLFLAFGSRPALGFTPSYSMHPLISKVTGVTWRDGGRLPDFSFDVAAGLSQISEIKPALTFITNPNNPTGASISLAEIEALAGATAAIGGLLVIDEAYAEFSEVTSAVTLLSKYPNIIVIRTMSKAFAFAGVRMGYLIASSQIVEAMLLVRLPYHLSALTQAAAEVALDFKDELLGTVSQLIESRKYVTAQLEKMGLSVIDSDANFILFSGFDLPATELWSRLLDKGVLIRDVGLLGHLRATIGNEAENQKFIDALQEILNGESQ